MDANDRSIGWDGPNDPDNPMNWTAGRKTRQIIVMGLNSFVTSLASTMVAPAIPEILDEYNSSNRALGSLIVSSFQLGYTIGPFFIAPMSEVYGRVVVYHICNALFCVFLAASGVSRSLAQLMVFRILSGVVGVCPIVIGSGTIADMVPREKMAGVLAIWSLGPLLGPVLSPIVGGVLAERAGWRWAFWLCLILAGIILLLSLYVYRESYAPVLLRRKAIRIRKNGSEDLSNVPPLTPIKPLLIKAMRRPLKLMVRSPIVAILSLYIGITFGYFYLLFTTFAQAFETCYSFSQQSAGFAYLGFGVGATLALALYSWYANKMAAKFSRQGRLTPESRLIPAMYGCILLPIGLFCYGWTLNSCIHWIAPIIGSSLFGFGLVLSFLPLNAYLIDCYTLYASSATTVNTVMRSLLGGLLPLAGPKMYDRLGLGWGNSVLAFIALLFSVFPFLFWRYGAQIRKVTDPGLDL